MIHEKSDNWHVKSSHLYLYHVKGHEQRWLRTYVIQNQNVFISMSTIFIFCFISLSFFSIFEIPFKCKKINFFCINNSSESNHMKYEMTLIFSKFIYHNGNNISKKIINQRKNCHIRYLKIYFIYLVLNFYFIISNIDWDPSFWWFLLKTSCSIK